MEKERRNKYYPDMAIPPGETLKEILETINMSQKDLAIRMDRPVKTINEIIKGKAAITPETALQLARVLKIEDSFWNNLEMNYKQDLCRIADREKLKNDRKWLKNFPIKMMVERHWIEKYDDETAMVNELLVFFGVASKEAWESVWGNVVERTDYTFRKSEKVKTNNYALATWLRAGELALKDKVVSEYSEEKLKKSLPQLKCLSREVPAIYIKKTTEILAQCGIAVLFMRELPNMPVHGVTRWLHKSKAVIQLSLRYKTDDQLWFSLFHELGHILLHKNYDFLEAICSREQKMVMEKEADEFAVNSFIPQDVYENFLRQDVTEQEILNLAQELGIAPGIIVGRWQHDTKQFNRFTGLKVKLAWN